MKRAVIYVREVEGTSLAEQIDACRRYAGGQPWMVVSAFLDLHVGGPAYRLGMRGILDFVANEDVDVVIAVAPENMSKDPARLESIQETLQSKACELHFVQSG